VKPKSFRLSDKALENLAKYATKEKSNPNRALNILLEALQPNKPQLEHPLKESVGEGDFFQLPPFLKCPYDLEAWEETAKVLKRCPPCIWKKSCPAWQGTIRTLPLAP